MNHRRAAHLWIGLIVASVMTAVAAGQHPVARWTFDDAAEGKVADAAGPHHGRAYGAMRTEPGAEGASLVFDGHTTHVSVPSHETLSIGAGPFTFAAWLCPYVAGGEQRMIAAKNDYAADKREWGLMVDRDARVRLWVRGNGWVTVGGTTVVEPGRWIHVAVTVEGGRGRLFVNGREEGTGTLPADIAATDAPMSFGGVRSGGRLMQSWAGALDEALLFRVALPVEEIQSLADRSPAPHRVPEPEKPIELWSGGEVPNSADLPSIEGVQFHVIKKPRPDTDGCRWTLGVGLAWHKGRLYASYGYNQGSENTPTEEAHVRVSGDGGRTWGAPVVMDHGEGSLGVSHGVFLSHKDRLWAFMGAFYEKFQRTHTRAYTLNETTGAWEPQGVVVEAGFWPMQEPQKMADGNWIMAGARVSHGYDLVGNLPAVAISRGDDFTRWDLVVIPAATGLGKIWGESTVIVEGKRITNISRYGGKALALVSFSEDFGRTWTPTRPSNLPMATSKPYAGTLSTGQRFLVCTTTADTGGAARR